MANWHGNRFAAGWTFRRVLWGAWEEIEDYDQITGAKIDLSSTDSLKTSGSMDYDETPPNEIDLVRAYYGFTDEDGEAVMVPVATFLIEGESPEFRALASGAASQSGALKACSCLKVLSDMKCRKPLVIPAGTPAVAKTVEIIEGAGLRVVADESDYVTRADAVFKADDTMLTVANWLLDAAGFASLYDDALGTVHASRYIEPTERPVTWTFRDDEQSTIGFGIVEENDWRSAPNVYTAVYSTDAETITATARNLDSDSRASLPRRGWRVKDDVETVNEIEGETPEDRLAALKELAASRIRSASAEVVKIKLSTLYVPIRPNDAVAVIYAGRTWHGSVTNMSVNANPAGETDVEVRVFVRHDLLIGIEGEIQRGGD